MKGKRNAPADDAPRRIELTVPHFLRLFEKLGDAYLAAVKRVGELEGENGRLRALRAQWQSLPFAGEDVPLPPEVLADALQDKIHQDSGPARPAKSVKVRR